MNDYEKSFNAALVPDLERRIAELERERDALAAALARFHALTVTLSLLPSSVRTRSEQAFVSEAANHPDPEAILAARDTKIRREILAELIGVASLVSWTDANPPLPHTASIEDAEAWLERDRQRIQRETLEKYEWRPISEAHEDCGTVVLLDTDDPGDVQISHVLNASWDDDVVGMTHFARVPAFSNAPREFAPKGDDKS